MCEKENKRTLNVKKKEEKKEKRKALL